MTYYPPAPAHEAPSPAYRVEAPRASDAVGVSLRYAFDNESGLPEDMAAMLQRLNLSDLNRTC